MKRNLVYSLTLASLICALLWACKPDEGITPPSSLYDPSPYMFNRPELEGPNRLFPTMVIPSDNPMTMAKVELGRHLFYDMRLSVNGNQSCNSCHKQEYNFGDNIAFSTNSSGSRNSRNAMPLVNLGWANNGLMWDGRTVDLEAASADAIFSELHPNPSAILDILSEDSLYDNLFAKAFEDGAITLENINKSLASFMRSIVSIDSKYDRYVKFGINELSQEEFRGFEMVFSSEEETVFIVMHPRMFSSLISVFTILGWTATSPLSMILQTMVLEEAQATKRITASLKLLRFAIGPTQHPTCTMDALRRWKKLLSFTVQA